MLSRKALPAPVPVIIGDATIATRVLEPAGRSAGDVVLCHGTPWSSQIWGAVARKLSSEYRVFLWDMPGYGESSKGAALPLDLGTQEARLVALLEHWGLRSPHVVAHDIGGAVALGAHLLHEAEYAGLFLWDVVTLDPWGSPFFRLVAKHAHVFERLPPALHAALVNEYIASAVDHRLPAPDIDVLAAPWLDRDGQSAFYRQIAALDPVDTRPIASRLHAVRCPTRIGWGALDPWIPVAQAYELQDVLPGEPSVVELDGVGHLAPIEASASVHRAIREWLERAWS